MKTTNLRKLFIFFSFLILHSSFLILTASPNMNMAFMPHSVPQEPHRVELSTAGGGLTFVRCELDGKPCTMLFDTGATHTTFDIGFVKREFPGRPMRQVMDSGDTNVSQNPSIFTVGTLKIGDAEFGGFTAMAIDLSSLHGPVGEKLDGVLGMNIIGACRTIVSLGGGEIVFGLGKEARDDFERPAMRINDMFDFTILLATDCGKGEFPVIVDSGSSWTFLQKDCGWAATTNEVSFMARDINGAGGLKPLIGEKGILRLKPGVELEIAPLLSVEPLNRIGADVLRRYDMLVELRAVAFRKNRKNETQAE